MPVLHIFSHSVTSAESVQGYCILTLTPNARIKVEALSGRDDTTTQKYIVFSYKALDGSTHLLYGAQQPNENSIGVMMPTIPILNAEEIYCTINDPLLADKCSMWLTFEFVDKEGNIIEAPK